MINKKNNRRKVNAIASDDVGYANRMYTVLSGLLIAILTDSACIIKATEFKNYIEPPLFNSFVAKIDLNDATEIKPKQAFVLNKNLNTLISTKLPQTFENLIYKMSSAYFYEISSNPIYYDKLLFYELVRSDTIAKAQIAINNTKMNHGLRLSAILQIGFEVGGNLLNRMWKVNSEMRAIIDKYKSEYFDKYYVIGIQIRRAYTTRNNFHKFTDCALELEYKLDYATIKNKTVKWFLATDFNDMSFFKDQFKNKYFKTEGKSQHVAHFYLLNFLFKPFGFTNPMRNAILDVELLSLCDEIIITAGSIFGFLSVMKHIWLHHALS